jgi:hypothetical protein
MEAGLAAHICSLGEFGGIIRAKSDGGGSMNAWLVLVGGVLAVMGSWISSWLILARLKSLKAERYQFSDLFYPGIYEKYWGIAPQRGWSRVPVFMLAIPAVYSGLVIMFYVVKFYVVK